MRCPVFSLFWCLLLGACAERSYASEAASEGASGYPLDAVSRWVADGALSCEKGGLVSYRGDRLRYHRTLRVHPAFRERLRSFETVVDELSRAHFGRPPRRIVHLGAYACRAVRGRPELISEHALGNALDVAGFDFGPLARKSPSFRRTPKPLRRAFEVRVDKHWSGVGARAPHAAFLRALADRIAERPDVFRVVLGPGWPGHHNHFHLDCAPYRLIGFDRL